MATSSFGHETKDCRSRIYANSQWLTCSSRGDTEKTAFTDAAREAVTEPLFRYPTLTNPIRCHRISLRSKGGSSPCSPRQTRLRVGWPGARRERPFSQYRSRRHPAVRSSQGRPDHSRRSASPGQGLYNRNRRAARKSAAFSRSA